MIITFTFELTGPIAHITAWDWLVKIARSMLSDGAKGTLLNYFPILWLFVGNIKKDFLLPK